MSGASFVLLLGIAARRAACGAPCGQSLKISCRAVGPAARVRIGLWWCHCIGTCRKATYFFFMLAL